MSATIPERIMPASRAGRPDAWRPSRKTGPRTAAVAAVLVALGLVGLGVEEAGELADGIAVVAVLGLLATTIAMLLVGVRVQRNAEARTRAALDRAVAAEAGERSRADELARILVASESLALTGEGQVDYLRVLEALTPDGGSSLLVRAESDSEGVVVAAHGPLALAAVGTQRPLSFGQDSEGGDFAPLASFSATGRVVGAKLPPGQIGGDLPVRAALAIGLTDHGGRRLGWLGLVDHEAERILEPAFVTLAQLVASQIGVAMENNALLARVRRQLAEVRSVQEQLVQASKMSAVGELAAAVAHEVNNPLTGILGFAELLMAELPEDDPRHGEAAVIRDEAVRSRSIIRALLEFARPHPPQRIPSDLNELARSALELIRFRASEAGVRIVASYGDLPTIAIDSDAFRQVLLNLFNNAVDAMPFGGELRVVTVAEHERLGVVVADVGVGMDTSTRERIFAPFFSTRAGSAGGTGLGLSVSLQIVESHGGSIDVESTPGRGSVFTVWMPLESPAAGSDVVIPATAGTAGELGTPVGTAAA
jgi:signal transduction histidine kinase